MQKIGSLGKMFFAIYGPDIIVYVKTFTPNNLWIFVSGWTGNGISLLWPFLFLFLRATQCPRKGKSFAECPNQCFSRIKHIFHNSRFYRLVFDSDYQTGLWGWREREKKDTDIDCHVLSSGFVSLVISTDTTDIKNNPTSCMLYLLVWLSISRISLSSWVESNLQVNIMANILLVLPTFDEVRTLRCKQHKYKSTAIISARLSNPFCQCIVFSEISFDAQDRRISKCKYKHADCRYCPMFTVLTLHDEDTAIILTALTEWD